MIKKGVVALLNNKKAYKSFDFGMYLAESG